VLKWSRVFVLLVAALACSACGPRYFVEPPTHEAGKICASVCESQKEQRRCESEKSRIISRCSGIADDKQRHNCEGGNGAGNYCGPPALPSCSAPYAQCLLSCGGTVNEVRTDTGIPVY